MANSSDHELKQSAMTVLNLHRCRKGVFVRMAGFDDISSLIDLNTSSIRSLGRKGLFMPMPETFFARVIAEGVTIILEKEGHAVGYCVAVPAGERNAAFLPVPPPGRAGLLFGTALNAAFRGQGWQKWLINLRVEIFEKCGFSEAQCTVSPSNIPSIINLIDSGFEIAGLKSLLDGYPRFLVRHDLDCRNISARKYRIQKRLTLSADLSDHKALLNEGFFGISVLRCKPLVVVYAKYRRKIQ